MKNVNIKGAALLAVLSLVIAAALLPFATPSVSLLFGDGSIEPDIRALAAAYSSFGGWASAAGRMIMTRTGLATFLVIASLAFLIIAIYDRSIVLRRRDRTVKDGPYGGRVRPYRGRQARNHLVRWDGKSPVEQAGVVVGCDGRDMLISPCTHYICFAPSNSGKSRRQVYLNIDYLTYQIASEDWNGAGTVANLVVSDPSLELYSLTKDVLERERGYKVLLLDLERGGTENGRWNPLSDIISLSRQGDREAATNRATALGAVLFPSVDAGENAWVYEGAASCFAAVAYWIATSPDVPDDCRHLYSVCRTIISLSTGEDADDLKRFLRATGDDVVVILASGFLAAKDKQCASILSSMLSGLTPFCTPSMAYLTSGSTIDPEEMADPGSRIALFIKTLPKGDPRMRIAAAFMDAHLQAAVRAGERRGCSREQWVIGDEWAGMPRYNILFAFLQGRKYNLHHALWYQDSSLSSMGSERDSLLANADSICLYKAGNIDDARLISDLAGVRTVATRTQSDGGGGVSAQRESIGEAKDPVWEPADLVHSNPYRDGVYLVNTITSRPNQSGLFEGIPVKDVTETPMAGHFGTFGSPEHEAAVITAAIDGLKAAVANTDRNVPFWVPAAVVGEKEEQVEADAVDLFLE